jgi:hypothetical protein
MRDKEMRLKTILLMLVIIILFSSTATGCSIYRNFTMRNEIAGCSFKVPLLFGPLTMDESGSDMVSVFGTLPTFIFKYPSDLYMDITVNKKNSFYSDYRSLLEYSINEELKWLEESEFNLVERSAVTINGACGEQVIYDYVRIKSRTHQDLHAMVDGSDNDETRVPAIAYRAFIENNGFLWDIGIFATTDMTTRAKEYYEHIINSFKF